MTTGFYESETALGQYLLFHYGTPEQICPLLPDARAACGFPVRCVTDTLAGLEFKQKARALDLGCAVGRSSLELGRHFEQVIGIDLSARFITAAQRIQTEGAAVVRVPREGNAFDELRLELPPGLRTERVAFETGNACALQSGLGKFDLVLMANLIDRLPDPSACLAQLPDLVAPDGWLVITSPYTWLEEYTPREKWLDGNGRGTLAELRTHLAPVFSLHRAFDLTFLIREHRRKYQWSIAEASVWRRSAD